MSAQGSTLDSLVSPYGLVSRLSRLPVADGEPRFAIYSGSLGNPGRVLDEHPHWSHDPTMGNVDGAGGDLDPARASFLAVAESLERYSSCAWRSERMIWASAAELGDEALPPHAWPHCSPAELADPKCVLVAPDSHAPMRWVQGWSLTRRRPVYVPAVLVWLKNPPQARAERFTHTVSTGCSVHTDPVAAVVGGLQEIVERDALTLMWLHRMRLPRLVFAEDSLAEPHREAVRRGRVPHLETRIFDATTDLGIPVLYGLQLADHDRPLSQLVAATCEADPGRAIAKLYREMASVRVALRTMASGERAFAEETISVVAGALAMGGREKRHRFGFLLDGPRPQRRLEDLPRPPGTEPPVVLKWLLEKLHPAGCEVIVVDITTDEALQAGATAVRVLVPQLMPLSFDRHGRYLAHPRLWQAPAAMGHPCLPEAELNPDPQPFA